ncbi:hypothetical protein B0H11DRAFT_2244199 [Mycena galericulata]|nr:hypothetical protein B0H11DRAFT_2244199 [Mycena galericulata]
MAYALPPSNLLFETGPLAFSIFHAFVIHRLSPQRIPLPAPVLHVDSHLSSAATEPSPAFASASIWADTEEIDESPIGLASPPHPHPRPPPPTCPLSADVFDRPLCIYYIAPRPEGGRTSVSPRVVPVRADAPSPSCVIYMGNLPFGAEEADVHERFEPFSPFKSARFSLRPSGESGGFTHM